jgi:hypothetical protein
MSKYKFLKKIPLRSTGVHELWFENVHMYPVCVKGSAVTRHKLFVIIRQYKNWYYSQMGKEGSSELCNLVLNT